MAEHPTLTMEPSPGGPAVAPGAPNRRRRRLRRVLFALAGGLVVLVALIPVGRSLLLHRYDQAITKATLLSPSSRVTENPVAHAPVTGPLNYLLVGSDLRAEDPQDGQRSDTIIIAHVSAALDQVSLISIPRDLFVDIPADRSLHFRGDTTKINAAFQYGGGGAGGIRLLSETLTGLTGVRFNGAMVVDFAGLEHAVDLVGGVNLCVDEPAVSIHTGNKFVVGCQEMNGAVALDYVRQRYQFADGDFARQLHQQEFLKSFFTRVMSMGVLSNPLKLDDLLRSVAGAMTVDTGSTSVADLVFALSGLRPTDLTGVKVPFYLDTVNKQSIVRAGWEADGLFAALCDDTIPDWTRQHPQWLNKI